MEQFFQLPILEDHVVLIYGQSPCGCAQFSGTLKSVFLSTTFYLNEFSFVTKFNEQNNQTKKKPFFKSRNKKISFEVLVS